jgi:hypothetical protein
MVGEGDAELTGHERLVAGGEEQVIEAGEQLVGSEDLARSSTVCQLGPQVVTYRTVCDSVGPWDSLGPQDRLGPPTRHGSPHGSPRGNAVPGGWYGRALVTPGRVLAELTALAERLGVGVRAEPFGNGMLEGRGGLCWLDGKPLVVMDETLGVEDRIAVLAEALAKGGFDLDAASVAPQVRERIEVTRRRKTRPPSKKRADASHPGLARARPRGK